MIQHPLVPAPRRLSARGGPEKLSPRGWPRARAGSPWTSAVLTMALLSAGCPVKPASKGKCPSGAPASAGAPAEPAGTQGPMTEPGATPGRASSGGSPSGTPLPQGSSILAAAERYTTHRACVAEVGGSLPPELTREADPSNLAERICQTRRALAERNVSLCDEIQDPAWPAACRRLYAEATGRPDVCPTRVPRALGREPACVALASRDPGLCRAVRHKAARARCRAILGAASACRAEGSGGQERACQRDRLRWRAVFSPVTSSLRADFRATATLSITPPGGRPVPLSAHAPNRGVVLSSRGRMGLRIDSDGAAGAAPFARPPASTPRGNVHSPRSRSTHSRAPMTSARPTGPRPAPVGSGRTGSQRPAGEAAPRPGPAAPRAKPTRIHLWLDVGQVRAGTIRVGAGRGRGRVCGLVNDQWIGRGKTPISGELHFEKVSRRRGGELIARLRLRVGGPGGLRIESTVVTFIRDVVPPGWLAGGCARFLDRLRATHPIALNGGHARPGDDPGTRPGDDPMARSRGSRAPGDANERPCYFVAHWDGLAKTGYRVYGIRSGGACARVGLLDRDVVQRMQGRPLRAWADVESLYRQLSARTPLRLRVRRGGRTVTLRR